MEQDQAFIYEARLGYDVNGLARRLHEIVAPGFGGEKPGIPYFKRQIRTWGQLGLISRAGVTSVAPNSTNIYAEISIYETLIFTHLTSADCSRAVLACFAAALREPVAGHARAIDAALNGAPVVLVLHSYAWLDGLDVQPYTPDSVPAGLAQIRVDLETVVNAVSRAHDALGPIPVMPGLRPEDPSRPEPCAPSRRVRRAPA